MWQVHPRPSNFCSNPPAVEHKRMTLSSQSGTWSFDCSQRGQTASRWALWSSMGRTCCTIYSFRLIRHITVQCTHWRLLSRIKSLWVELLSSFDIVLFAAAAFTAQLLFCLCSIFLFYKCETEDPLRSGGFSTASISNGKYKRFHVTLIDYYIDWQS